MAAASTASASVDEPSPLESGAAIEAIFSEPVARTPLPGNLIDAALATEWLGIVPEKEVAARTPGQVAIEAAFGGNSFAGNEADWLAPGGKIITEFGTTRANPEEVNVEETNTDQPWLAEELLERVFG